MILKKGDSLKLIKELPDESVNCILTDPPYFIDYKSRMSSSRKYISEVADNINWDKIDTKFSMPFEDMFRVLKPNSYLYVFTRWDCIKDLPVAKDMLIWFKKDFGMGRLYDWSPSYECILVYHKGKPYLRGRRMMNVLSYYKVSNFKTRDNILNKQQHPTEKPVSLLSKIIEVSTDINDVVLDLFMGSGSTGEAALKLNRDFIGFEIDTTFYNRAVNRLHNIKKQKKLI